MGYTVKYSGTREEKLNVALQDARDYVGQVRWDKIVMLLTRILYCEEISAKKKVKHSRLALSFAGVQGLPATAVMKYLLTLLKG